MSHQVAQLQAGKTKKPCWRHGSQRLTAAGVTRSSYGRPAFVMALSCTFGDVVSLTRASAVFMVRPRLAGDWGANRRQPSRVRRCEAWTGCLHRKLTSACGAKCGSSRGLALFSHGLLHYGFGSRLQFNAPRPHHCALARTTAILRY